jgi:hypothetical protein
MLLQGGGGGEAIAPRETEATAELDGAGLLGLQRQMMADQDQALEAVERSVKQTRVRH